jgi:hypothetical protein
MLPLKIISEVKNWKHHTLKPRTKLTAGTAASPKKKTKITSGTKVKFIEDGDSTYTGQNTTISPLSSFQALYPAPVKVHNTLSERVL